MIFETDVMPPDPTYTPAAGRHWLTPLYDFGVAALTREHRWRSALITQVDPKASDVIVDVGCGAGSLLVLLAKTAPSARLIGIDPDPQRLDLSLSRNSRTMMRDGSR